MQVKVWLESGVAESILENQAAKLATEMWRVLHVHHRSRNAPPSLFGKRQSNGDGLRRATGPDSFEALVEAAKKRSQEQS